MKNKHTEEKSLKETFANYVQMGRVVACGHCKPEKGFDLTEKYGVKCECICHENKLGKPYQHDTKCCDDMNGMVAEESGESWRERFYQECEMNGIYGNDGSTFYEINNVIKRFIGTELFLAHKAWNEALVRELEEEIAKINMDQIGSGEYQSAKITAFQEIIRNHQK